jgi:hypothetical protein
LENRKKLKEKGENIREYGVGERGNIGEREEVERGEIREYWKNGKTRKRRRLENGKK